MVTFVFPKFDVRDFPETSFKNPDLVKAKFNEAMAAVNARDKELERLALNNEALETKFTEASRTVAINNAELQSLRKELATEVGRAQELRERLDKLDLQLPKISVQDLVGQFKGNIDRINAEVISRKTDGMLVDSVEVEVRAGIDVSNGLQISQLPASALGANSASVLRFNLRPSSPLKIVEDDELG